ncbi:DeoR/GlpR family DNA-binding transcription regulator [Gayadomonas joobiniege]|uniref:DeoR/GlpR family DNA-binding transcription regulator n=1 Tax=Gayadomonas joobiniege TaxID=1234606 RepID=UPI00035C761D|nr:DeoR/GlpR family DNA-binding transcription regulator [Gayadomonas joobiniege]
MLEIQRQQRLLDILEEKKFATVAQLTELLHSSEATIRRDLVKLDKQNKITRVHGGAKVLTSASGADNEAARPTLASPTNSAKTPQQINRALAQKAAALCEDGESVIINGGMITDLMGDFLRERKLNILTNSFALAHDLVTNSRNQVSLPGGEVYREQGIVLSAFDNDTTQHYSASKMFIGTPGLSEFGVTESDALLVRAEQKMRRQAEKLVVLAPSTSLEKRSSFIFCSLNQIDILITERSTDNALLQRYRQHGLEIVLV